MLCGQRRVLYHVEVNLFHSKLALHSSCNLNTVVMAYMMHLLVSNGSIVLKNVVIGCSRSNRQLLESRLLGGHIW